MPRIAIIEKISSKVVNISEDEALPSQISPPVHLDGAEITDPLEFDQARYDFIEAHHFVFSDTARIGDDWNGEEFTPPQEEALSPRQNILQRIHALEISVTPRRIREAILGNPGWLEGVENEIQTLRQALSQMPE